jgi:hypothetical protein
MMRGSLLAAILTSATLIFDQSVFAQSEDKEGRAWLDANKQTPSLNVTGLWQGGEWGRVPLSQSEGGRRIIGTGDGWDVSGMVSGKDVFLLFSHNGKVGFSAKLTADGANLLTGVYAPGLLSPASKTRPIRLSRPISLSK